MNIYILAEKNGEGNVEARNYVQKSNYCALAATVYHVWQARNLAYWQNIVPRLEVVVKSIQGEVCMRIRTKVSGKWSTTEISWPENLETCIS